MARHWLGGEAPDQDEPPDQDGPADHTAAPDPLQTDPIGDKAESERDEEPADVHAPEPERPDERARLTDRVGTVARRAVTGLTAALIARLPVVQAAMLPRLTRLICAVVGGLLLCASFPTLNWWWGAVVAAALLAWVLTHPRHDAGGRAGLRHSSSGWRSTCRCCRGSGSLVGPIPWIALATVSALFPALFGLFAVLVRRLPGWPIWFALVWAAAGVAEVDRSRSAASPGVRWPSVRRTARSCRWSSSAASRCCPWRSCWWVSASTAIALEIVKWWRSGHPVHGAADREAEPPPPAVVLPGVCICLVLFASVIVWPQVRHAGTGSGGEPSVTVAAVQGNVPRLGFEFNEQRRAVLDNHVRETLALADDVRAGAAPQPQLVIWPEDSSDIDPLVNPDAALAISQAAAAIGAPILIGSVLEVPGRPPEDPHYTNTMIVWNPATGPADRHDKEIVQPFGEYLPMPWLFKHLSGYAGRAGSFVPRPGSDVVHIAGVPVGVATCWEVIFDRVPATRGPGRCPAAGRARPTTPPSTRR